MMDKLTVEERFGLIVLCVPMGNPFTGERVMIPVISFPDVGVLKEHIKMLQDYVDKNSTKLPDCIEKVFEGR